MRHATCNIRRIEARYERDMALQASDPVPWRCRKFLHAGQMSFFSGYSSDLQLRKKMKAPKGCSKIVQDGKEEIRRNCPEILPVPR